MGPRGRFYPYLYHCDYIGLLGTGFMQVFHLGRAPRTKETLPDFLKWRRVTRHPLVICGFTGSQRTPGNGASHYHILKSVIWLQLNSFRNFEPQTNKVAGYGLLLSLLQVSFDHQIFKLSQILLHGQILLLQILNFEEDILSIVEGKILPF